MFQEVVACELRAAELGKKWGKEEGMSFGAKARTCASFRNRSRNGYLGELAKLALVKVAKLLCFNLDFERFRAQRKPTSA